jgi:hypothetical protein
LLLLQNEKNENKMIQKIDTRETHGIVTSDILLTVEPMPEKPKEDNQPEKIIRQASTDFSKIPEDELLAAYSQEDFAALLRKYDPEYTEMDNWTPEENQKFRELIKMTASIDNKEEFNYITGKSSKHDVEMIDILRSRDDSFHESLSYLEKKYIEFNQNDDSLWQLIMEIKKIANEGRKKTARIMEEIAKTKELEKNQDKKDR